MRATTASEVEDNFDKVCNERDTYFGLRTLEPKSIDADVLLCTTMRAFAFHEYVLGRPKSVKSVTKRVALIAPKFPHNPTEDKKYRDKLAREARDPNWYNSSQSLGKPYNNPIFVWITKARELESAVGSSRGTSTQATAARDALGLIATKKDTYLVTVKFQAGCLHGINGLKMVRPAFAHKGNSRFAVRLPSTPIANYAQNWGMTAHLAKMANEEKTIHGVPERVCLPIPLAHLHGTIKPEPLGWVETSRGNSKTDNDVAFVRRLLGRRTLPSIKKQLLTLANKP